MRPAAVPATRLRPAQQHSAGDRVRRTDHDACAALTIALAAIQSVTTGGPIHVDDLKDVTISRQLVLDADPP
jgi:hypothetical protein